ncbi:hypothetical protein [Nostoc sp. WHI]|uniref:hypothetical protein n=1 Tax=Nostoc sp. WHI TaxID=2650611 RepID=UPI0018C59415|nr:hypothetical protein [Nostoc sp. WHI]MBG1265350.1 hypothetical protein [Nostoc sp. WHI]
MGNLEEAANPYVKDILDFLKDKTVDSSASSVICSVAAEALGKIEQLDLNNVDLYCYFHYFPPVLH